MSTWERGTDDWTCACVNYNSGLLGQISLAALLLHQQPLLSFLFSAAFPVGGRIGNRGKVSHVIIAGSPP